ncbi:hypothetical protein B566_EDAN001614 [Ephemera danica]|nr:hypothetical protein B566_EDAN001614 [Ephemera danica]
METKHFREILVRGEFHWKNPNLAHPALIAQQGDEKDHKMRFKEVVIFDGRFSRTYENKNCVEGLFFYEFYLVFLFGSALLYSISTSVLSNILSYKKSYIQKQKTNPVAILQYIKKSFCEEGKKEREQEKEKKLHSKYAAALVISKVIFLDITMSIPSLF